MSNDVIEVVGDLNPVDLEYLSQYEEAQERQGFKQIPPGRYLVKMPAQVTAEGRKFEARDGKPERKFVEAVIQGATIVGGEFDGKEIGKFIRVNTLPKPGQNYSDGVDFLKAFGVDPTGFRTVEDFKLAFEGTSGQVSLNEVYLTYQANYKNTAGKRVYLKAKDFQYTTASGEKAYKRFLYLRDGIHVPPAREEEFLQEQGNPDDDARRALPKVWANLEPGFRGWTGK